MTDLIFSELSEDGDYGWFGKHALDFGGTSYTIELLIRKSRRESGITERQKEAFQCFIKQWPKLQSKLMEALIQYYNEEERFAWGPDDEEEFKAWWPEIETRDALLQAVTPETMVIPWDFTMEKVKGGRYVYLLFSRAWGGEDWEDNGIGVGFLNEEIDEIAYKDIAF